MQDTTIIVPCYNEALRLRTEDFLEFCCGHPAISFLFVDDGSSDATAQILEQLASKAARQISVLRLVSNVGKAEAVRQGVVRALATSSELIAFWDADLATPLRNAIQFARILENPSVELVLGSRVRLLGRQIRRSPMRHYLGRGFATLASLALGLAVYDTQCGAKMFRNNELWREIFARPFELGWTFDIEIVARLMHVARRSGVAPASQIVEVPLDAWVDVPGSKIRPKHFPKIALEIGKLLIVTRRR